MFEHITYETILNRMLDKVPSTFDKREGAIIYDALAPCAIELQLMYIELDHILKETFGDTASREYLIRRAKERGLTPLSASNAVLKGEFNINVPIGSRFSLYKLNYVVIEKITDFEYKLKCETKGSEGNGTFGNLIPIEYIDGLTKARLTELLIPGEDEEDTEIFRTRYLNSFNIKAYGGNVSDYLEKTNSISGVGATKVTPVWDGGGTVKLTILDSEFNLPTKTLVDTVQNIIDPTKDSSGLGVAPIGHIVTVESATEISVNISTSLTFDLGYSFDNTKRYIIDTIEEYLLQIRKNWGNSTNSVVRIAQIEARILNIKGIIDIKNTKINNESSNLTLTNYEIPKLGGVCNE